MGVSCKIWKCMVTRAKFGAYCLSSVLPANIPLLRLFWPRFGADVMHTMVQWLHALLLQHSLSTTSSSVLDVGTGNALLPLELAKLGYTDLTGSDYSPQSIALAHQLMIRHSQHHIRLVVWAKLEQVAGGETCRLG